jgi:hypothetical protein
MSRPTPVQSQAQACPLAANKRRIISEVACILLVLAPSYERLPMLNIRFIRSDDVETHHAGPFAWMQAEGGVMQAGPHGETIARYKGGTWSVGGRGVTRCIVESRREHGDLHLRVSDQAVSEVVAKSTAIEFVDGAVYAHPGRRLLATLDERQHHWKSVGKTWSAVRVEPVND